LFFEQKTHTHATKRLVISEFVACTNLLHKLQLHLHGPTKLPSQAGAA
jgi:hypothetical protein